MVGNWKGDEIDSYFTSEELLEKIDDYFDVYNVEYYWRSVLSDALAMLDREGIVSLYYCKFVSRALKLVKLDKFFCCHFLIEACRKDN